MAVPAHDQRDFEFGRKCGLPIKVVVVEPGRDTPVSATMPEASTNYGRLVNSAEYRAGAPAVMARMIADAERQGIGEGEIQFRLKDWGISHRQRYWGTPIPIIYCAKDGVVPVPYDQLPVKLPTVATFSGRGDSPLAQLPDFVNVLPGLWRSRTARDRHDGHLRRFVVVLSSASAIPTTPRRSSTLPLPRAGCRWISTSEASNTRSCTCCIRASSRVLRDIGLVRLGEPFVRLLTQGMVLKDGAVMSKSKGNVVDPDAMVESCGADALRLYMSFVAPPEKELEWSDAGLKGSSGFLLRVLAHRGSLGGDHRRGRDAQVRRRCTPAERSLRRKTHDTIRRVTIDIEERMHLNTAVSSLMELVNELYAFSETTAHGGPTRGEPPTGVVERPQTLAVLREAIDALVAMLSPFAPHVAEEMWQMLGNVEGLTRGRVALVRRQRRQSRGSRRPRPDQRQGARPPDGSRGRL